MFLFQKKRRTFTSVFFFFLFYSIGVLAQVPSTSIKKSNGDPLFFVDGKEVLSAEITSLNPNDVAMMTVLKEKGFEKYGEKGKNGVVLIETKAYCRKRFQQYFSDKSTEYKKIITAHPNDQNIQYILNGKVLEKDYEGDLASIADSTFIGADVIGTEALNNYKVTGKQYGLLIKTKVKNEPDSKVIPQSKFEPELLIISPGKVSFEPSAAKPIKEINKKLKQDFSKSEQPDLSKVREENSRLMVKSAISYAQNISFFSQISMFSQDYLTYRFIERFPNTLILLKDTVANGGLTDLSKIAREEKMAYVLSFPSAHIAEDKGQYVLHLKVQLYETESNSLVLDQEYIGDQINQGFEFSCDGSIQCTINNALSAALADVIRQIASNNKTLKAERKLAQERFKIIEELSLKQTDPSLIQSVVSKTDSTIELSDLYHTLYNDDKSKLVGFFFRTVDKQTLKTLSESKGDRNVKILTGATIKDEGFLDVPQNYAYIVKGVFSKGKWYYKKDMVTYFESENEDEGRLEYLNNLQSWDYFKEKLIAINPGFWEGKLFEKIEDKRKDPDWENYKDMWETEERENRDYIGMYSIVADRLKEEKIVAEDNFKDSIANNVFKPFYANAIKSKLYQISGYESVLKKILLIYAADKKVIINPMEIKNDKGVVGVRYFVFLTDLGKIYEWTYFPVFKKKIGDPENGIMKNLSTITTWNYGYDTLDDEQFWSKYVLIKENGVYKHLK